MRMPARSLKTVRRLGVEEIEKDEGLETLAEVGRAHQAGDRPVMLAVRPMDDLTWALSDQLQLDLAMTKLTPVLP